MPNRWRRAKFSIAGDLRDRRKEAKEDSLVDKVIKKGVRYLLCNVQNPRMAAW